VVRFPQHGPVPERLKAWATWVYTQADLACRTAGPAARTWDGKEPTWLDYCGIHERGLIEAAMHAGLWEPTEDVFG
jgi:hypothetical protein